MGVAGWSPGAVWSHIAEPSGRGDPSTCSEGSALPDLATRHVRSSCHAAAVYAAGHVDNRALARRGRHDWTSSARDMTDRELTRLEGKRVLAAVARWVGKQGWGEKRSCGSCDSCAWYASRVAAGQTPDFPKARFCSHPRYRPVPSGRKARMNGTGPALYMGDYSPWAIGLDGRIEGCTQPVVYMSGGPRDWPRGCKRYVEKKVPSVVVHKLSPELLGVFPRSVTAPIKRPKYLVLLRDSIIGWYREWPEAMTAAEKFARQHDEHRLFDFYSMKTDHFIQRWTLDDVL